MSVTTLQAATLTAPLLNGERLLGFAAIAATIPGHRGNGHIDASTVFRWATKGVRVPSGVAIRLEAVRLGSSWKTSVEAVARFSAKLTDASLPADDGAPPADPVPTPKQRSGAAASASKELDRRLASKR